jgi:hypothetical protein
VKAVGDRKVCSQCRAELTLADFQRNRSQPDGLHSQCRPCVSAANRRWREANPDKKRAQNARSNARHASGDGLHLRRYSIDGDIYRAMLLRQGGCGICGSPDPGYGRAYFAVDHDHSCCPASMRSCGSCVRGLLCHACNTGIGLLRDSVENLRAAIAYLEK